MRARVVVVTGGASGIGLAAARRFAAAGDRIVLIDRSKYTDEVAATLDSARAVNCDVADVDAVAAAVAAIVEEFGGIDILVNNAGIVGEQQATLDTSIESMQAILAVNLEGAYTVAYEAARVMAAHGGGVIVNTASLAGLVAVPNRTAYGASKAALIDLTRTLAHGWADRGVRVNAVLPGFVGTDILAKVLRDRAADRTAIEQSVPLGRLAEPDEIASAIEHLVNVDITGVALMVDGGFGAFGGVGNASAGGTTRPDAPATGRTVVIAGDGGAADSIALRFAANGDHVRRLDAELLTAEATIAPAVADVVATSGPIDVLVTCIGGGEGDAANDDMPPHQFARVVDRDLTTLLRVMRTVGPIMIAQGGGIVVTTVAAKGGSVARDAAAAGAIMAMRSFACEWARHGIRVNTVQPGASSPPAAIDEAALFLASPEASYMTGSLYPL